MKTLQEIKDETAREYGHSDFSVLKSKFLTKSFGMMDIVAVFGDEIAKRYAQQVGEQVRKDAAENAEVEYRGHCFGDYIVDKQSILETEIKLP